MASFVLHVAAEDGGDFKLIWSGYGTGEPWTPKAYRVDGGLLQQAATAVRNQLRTIATMPEGRKAPEFANLLRKLAQRGRDLFLQLLPTEGDDASEVQQRLADVLSSAGGNRADLKVTLDTDKLLVPWGFVFAGDENDLPSDPVGALADMKGFWLSHFTISVAYGGSSSLPRPRKPACSRLLALHEIMFSGARASLDKTSLERLEALLEAQPQATMDWEEFFEACGKIQEDQDTVLYVLGHSDGQRIQLSDASDDPKYDLLAASMKRFRKRTRGTASIFLLNGCRTAAPTGASPEEPIAANFLKETRQSGYYGFIGTEAQVSNIFACRYGTEFLWRLFREGKSVGEAFDELLERSDLFPQNILYSCYADRAFRLSSTGTEEKRS